ncbi:MAG: tRNA pseudouridine(55) synthase TruB [Betaproteobacteria bacterium]|nr:tRNA pseudouridine(55) synthase TruB [Betaproteobacteria bacterium]
MTGAFPGGVLLLDKPIGWTSNAALGRARRLLGGVKAGHTGTLDPFASGLLPITVGEAGKFSRYSLEADKRYEATLKLGQTSTTGDPEGEVSATGATLPSDPAKVERVLHSFLGEQDQVPPMHSALKQQGVPLYELARKGLEVPRMPRRIQIHAIQLLDWSERDTLRVDVRCSKGTYVRVLAEDIGHALGCGAYLTALRRTAVGVLSIGQAIDLEGFDRVAAEQRLHRLLPASVMLSNLPRVDLDSRAARDLLDGKHPEVMDVNAVGEVQAWGPHEVFLGVAKVARGMAGTRLVPVRLMSSFVLP